MFLSLIEACSDRPIKTATRYFSQKSGEKKRNYSFQTSDKRISILTHQ
jgi:hypothetical protein